VVKSKKDFQLSSFLSRVSYIDRMFVILLLLVPILSIPWHVGIGGCDPSSYVVAAKKFAESHSLNYNHLFETRVTAWLPYMIAIALFGGYTQLDMGNHH